MEDFLNLSYILNIVGIEISKSSIDCGIFGEIGEVSRWSKCGCLFKNIV